VSTDALAGPLVGRDAELAELDAMLGVLAGACPRAVMLAGRVADAAWGAPGG
jgi:hypothetical protein